MKRNIEITGLLQNPNNYGTVMTFKTESGGYEQASLTMSQIDLMNMLGIKNLYDANGKKYEMELDDKSQLIGLRPIDTRMYGFGDFERMEKKINELISVIQKHITKEKSDPKTQI